MSRTVSARISKEMHDKLFDRCNRAGCTINDWLSACIDYFLTGSSDFDFGDYEEPDKIKEESKPEKVQDPHEGKIPKLHLHWENGKLVRDETTWEKRP